MQELSTSIQLRNCGATFALLLMLLLTCVPSVYSAECATPGADGDSAAPGVVNAYWSGTSNPNIGDSVLTLGPANGAGTPITAGDLLLLIQMQDADINSDNDSDYGDGAGGNDGAGYTNIRRAGRYEFVRAVGPLSLAGGTLALATPIIYNYSTQPATATQGKRTFQIIRVPQYSNLNLASDIMASPWNGVSGGVIVIDVANDLTFSGGNLIADGAGFRGGGARQTTSGSGANTDYRTPFSNLANSAKGEGIAGTPRLVFDGTSVVDTGVEGYPNGSFARGAPGNAGGGGTDGNPAANDQNTGGGGGGGFRPGGEGGFGWCPAGPPNCSETGGVGGAGVTDMDVSRITFGGGGGAGTTNNGTGTPGAGVASSGARGGGIVIVRARRIIGAGTISVAGDSANSTVNNDGSGGGGGGGAIIVHTEDASAAALTLSARGGTGGSNGNSTPHGPGGGGGGGFIGVSNNLLGSTVFDVDSGAPGVTEGDTSPFNQSYGAVFGIDGEDTPVDPNDVPGGSSGFECAPRVDKAFSPLTVSTGAPSVLTLTLENPNPDLGYTAFTTTDTLPAGMTIGVPASVNNTCGGMLTATEGSNVVTLTNVALAAQALCTVSLNVVSSIAGDLVNTIPAGASSAQLAGNTLSTLLPAEATLTINEALTAIKSVSLVSDPFNGTSTPLAIPGAVAEYTIAFTNPAAVAVDSNTLELTDAVPEFSAFINTPLTGGLPVEFVDGPPATGLSLGAAGIEYSNDDGATYTYVPGTGVDSAITHVRLRFNGPMAAATTASIRFRIELR